MKKDFLEEIVAGRTRKNRRFPGLVGDAVQRRALAKALAERREGNGLTRTVVAAKMRTAASASTKQKHEVPWTLVASAKRAKPRLVLVSSVEAGAHRGRKRSARAADVSRLGERLERAFVQAVKTAKGKAGRKG